MANSPKPSGAPNFYNTMAGMSPSGAAAPSPSSPSPSSASANEKQMLATKFFELAQKWAKTGKEEETYANKVMDVLKEYFTTVLKKSPDELTSAPSSAGPGASPGAGAPPPPPPSAGGEGTQPTPA